jgi:hypothetical protein
MVSFAFAISTGEPAKREAIVTVEAGGPASYTSASKIAL